MLWHFCIKMIFALQSTPRNPVKLFSKTNLVPRGRDPFGQRRGSGPLARDFESANRGLPVTLRRIKSKTQDGGEKWSRYISGRREIWTRKSWKSKYYPQTETRRVPENNRFDAKRCFSRSPNWLRKIEEGLAFSALENLTEFQLIFAHPEALVGSKNVIKLLKTAELKNRMKAIVVDEAHLVVDW